MRDTAPIKPGTFEEPPDGYTMHRDDTYALVQYGSGPSYTETYLSYFRDKRLADKAIRRSEANEASNATYVLDVIPNSWAVPTALIYGRTLPKVKQDA